MKMIKQSALALILGAIVLASAASAGYVGSVGGASSGSATGGSTYGTTSTVLYQDIHGPVGQPAPTIDGVSYGADFGFKLSEVISATSTVPGGVTGEASASFTTNGNQQVMQLLPNIGGIPANSYVMTSLNGKVDTLVQKDSIWGTATSSAIMSAESGAMRRNVVAGTGFDQMGGAAQITATLTHSGTGMGLAEASGDALFHSAVGDNDYSMGGVSGDAKLLTTNLEWGGNTAGIATILSATNMLAVPGTDREIGYARTLENIILRAQRDISFEGNSKIEGSLDGRETGETRVRTSIVDNEATSVMNGVANAINRHDSAFVNLILNPRAAVDNNDAAAGNTYAGFAEVLRDAPSAKVSKAIGEGYITSADWAVSALADPSQNYATVSGTTGFTADGLPAPLEGLGVGAWLQDTHFRPSRASAASTQYSSTGIVASTIAGSNLFDTLPSMAPNMPVSTFDDPSFNEPTWSGALVNNYKGQSFAKFSGPQAYEQTYRMHLNSMLYSPSGATNDAAGAYLGVASQTLLSRDFTVAPTNTMSLSIADQNGIEWLEGKNPNPLPGHYFPYTILPTVNQDAVQRASGLTSTTSATA